MTYDVQLQNEADDYYGREDWEDRAKWAESELEAALGRAEAAEAEKYQLHKEWSAALDTCDDLRARVAELEAAQQWRPVTEDWPAPDQNVPVRMRNGSIRWGHRYGDLWNLTGGRYSIGDVTHAYELPAYGDNEG